RPRDASGRPLPRGAPGVPPPPEDVALPPAESLAEAERLLVAGRPFHAHEVLEGTWKDSPADERALWRGLAQVAVGLTHTQRGNAIGAARLLRRGSGAVAAYADAPPYGLDAAHVVAEAERVATLVEQSGTDAVTPADVVLRLRA
ncbi:MAG: DUF309 domain-containing protein, partial [Actinomycetes bacterium]